MNLIASPISSHSSNVGDGVDAETAIVDFDVNSVPNVGDGAHIGILLEPRECQAFGTMGLLFLSCLLRWRKW